MIPPANVITPQFNLWASLVLVKIPQHNNNILNWQEKYNIDDRFCTCVMKLPTPYVILTSIPIPISYFTRNPKQ